MAKSASPWSDARGQRAPNDARPTERPPPPEPKPRAPKIVPPPKPSEPEIVPPPVEPKPIEPPPRVPEPKPVEPPPKPVEPPPEIVPEAPPELPTPKVPRGPSALSIAFARARREAKWISFVARRSWREHRERQTERAIAIRVPRAVDAAALVLLALVAASLVANGFGDAAWPEASAVYLASRLAQGVKVFSGAPGASWPGHVLLLELFARLHLAGWAAAQALAATSFFATAGLAFVAARPFGRVARLTAVAVALFAFEPLAHATRPTPELLAMPFVAAALVAALAGRGRAAAVLGAIASFVSPLALPVALVVVALAPKRAWLTFALSLSTAAVLLLGLAGPHALAGSARLFFEAAHPGVRIRFDALAESSALVLGLAALAPRLVDPHRRRLATWLAAAVLLVVASVVVRAEPSSLVVALPLVGLAAALAVEALARRYEAWSTDGRHAPEARRALAMVGVVLVVAAAVPRLGPVPELPRPGARFVAPTTSIGAPARGMFWNAEYPLSGRPSLVTQALWTLATRTEAVDRVAQAVAAQTFVSDVVAGDGPMAALVAMRLGRPLALELSDDRLAALSDEELEALRKRLEATRPRLVVSSTGGLFHAGPFATWLKARYRVAGTFDDGAGGWVYVLLRTR